MSFWSNPFGSIESFAKNPTAALNIPSGPASWLVPAAKLGTGAAIGALTGGAGLLPMFAGAGGVALTGGLSNSPLSLANLIGAGIGGFGGGQLGNAFGFDQTSPLSMMMNAGVNSGSMAAGSSSSPFYWDSGQGVLELGGTAAGATGGGSTNWLSLLTKYGPLALQAYGTLQSHQQANNLLSLMNPANIASNPAYQFDLSQGTQAIQRQAAQSGMTRSSNLDYELAKYNQGLAANFAQQQIPMQANIMSNAYNLENQSLGNMGSILGLMRFFGS